MDFHIGHADDIHPSQSNWQDLDVVALVELTSLPETHHHWKRKGLQSHYQIDPLCGPSEQEAVLLFLIISYRPQ